MRKLFIPLWGSLLTFVLCFASLQAQKPLTLERVMPGGAEFRSFYPQHFYAQGWIGNRLVWYDADTHYTSLKAYNPQESREEGREETLISKADVQSLLAPFGEDLGSSPVFPDNSVSPSGRYLVITGTYAVYLLEPVEKKVERYFPVETQNIKDWKLSRDESLLTVKTKDGVLAAVQAHTETQALSASLLSAALITIARDEADSVVYAEAVHQREFGIESGMFPAPNGSAVAFYRMDQSMVAPYPIVNTLVHKATTMPVRYPMAGEPSHHVTVGVFDLSTRRTTYLKTDADPEHYLINPAWNPQADALFMAELNRGQNSMEFNAYSAHTGERIKTLFVENDSRYVEPQMPAYFVPGTGGKQFVWLSRRNGFYNFFLYSAEGKLIRDLSVGKGEVTKFLGFDPAGKYLYCTANYPSPLQTNLYRVKLSNGKSERLTPQDGTHSPVLSPSKEYILDSYTSHTVPALAAVYNNSGKMIKELLRAQDPDQGYAMPQVELGTIKAADGVTDLYYRLVKPLALTDPKAAASVAASHQTYPSSARNASPAGKYPVIVYVYGGPHAQLVTDSWHWDAGGWDLYMAQEGYAVLTIDNRGSAGRGAEFEQVIHRQVGTQEMADQMQGVEFLKSLPWVDPDRIGVHGWSFGGFMTTNLMLSHPDVFKVGVAGGPVMDWSRYEVMYGERYNDSPQENPQGYQDNNLTLRAADLKGRLLLIHGTEDNVVLWQHAQEFVRACVSAGTYPDCMYYPGHEHNVIGPDRVHLYQTVTRYFKDFL